MKISDLQAQLSAQLNILFAKKVDKPMWVDLMLEGRFDECFPSEKIFPQCFFKSREGDNEFLAFGIAKQFTLDAYRANWIEQFNDFKKRLPHDCLICGAGAFTLNGNKKLGRKTQLGKKSNVFSRELDSSSLVFYVPKLVLYQDSSNSSNKNKLKIGCFIDEHVKKLPDLLAECLVERVTVPTTHPRTLLRIDTPDKAQWLSNVEDILKEIKSTSLEKVVVARKTELKLTTPLHFFKLRSLFLKSEKNCYTAYFRLNKDKSFLCLSPERLLKVSDNRLFTEALAGTHARGKDSTEDLNLEKKLSTSPKELAEHRYVVDFLKEVINPKVRSPLNVGNLDVLKLAHVQHLKTNIEGQLKPGIDIVKLLFDIHPTPAVGGWPKAEAQAVINSKENFNRAWYTGPLGWLKGNDCEFIVNIRSCLIDGKSLCVFSGAGIVADSQPLAEWNELEQKTKLYLSCFAPNSLSVNK